MAISFAKELPGMQHSCWCSEIFVDKMTGLALEQCLQPQGLD